MLCRSVAGVGEIKSLSTGVNEECKSLYFEVAVFIDEFPFIREINSVVEGKRRAFLVDLVKSCWGNLRNWATFTGESLER